MDKTKIIETITTILQSSTAVQCELALIFIEHMTGEVKEGKSDPLVRTVTD